MHESDCQRFARHYSEVIESDPEPDHMIAANRDTPGYASLAIYIHDQMM